MKKEIIVLFVLIIFLSSCASIDNAIASTGYGNYFGINSQEVGGKGLMLSFLEPKSSITIPEGPDGIFRIKLQLQNYISNTYGIHGALCIRDTLSDNFGGIPEGRCQDINLDTAKLNERGKIVPYTSQVFDFGSYYYLKSNPNFPSASRTNIIADIKYEVEETALSSMCIQSSSTQSFCSDDQRLSITQPDLPIKITGITAKTFSGEFSGTNVQLTITMSQTKEGQILTPGEVLGAQTYPGSALVGIQVYINDMLAKCTGLVDGRSLLISQDLNQKIIKCSTKLVLNQDYIKEAQIRAVLNYGFIDSVSGPEIIFEREVTSV